MPINSRYRNSASLTLPSFPPGVKWLITANVVVYILQVLFVDVRVLGRTLLDFFNLLPYAVLHGALWQLVSYMFLHGGIGHILFNMLALWMFGASVEETWGTRRFLQYYFICGVGAGVCVVIANRIFGDIHQPTIGASGAIYGVLLAFAMLFPEAEILIMFLFPVKAKYAVMIFGAVALAALDRGRRQYQQLCASGRPAGGIYLFQDAVLESAGETGWQQFQAFVLVAGIQDATRQEEISGIYEETRFG